jgi:hypothetical protein
MRRPRARSIDLQFRPASYWDHTDPVTAILSGIKGQNRRDMVRDFVTGQMPEELGEIHPDLVANTLDEATRNDLGAAHPSWMGGEYLPDYLPGEVEIARIVLASATRDVISIRARRRRAGRRILYRIVDEYHEPGRNPWGCRPGSSELPLTLGRLIELIDGAQNPDFDVEDGTLTDHLRDMQEMADPEDTASFVTVESDFYRSISRYYEGKAREWLERWRREWEKDD